jgi:hypothetical protein
MNKKRWIIAAGTVICLLALMGFVAPMFVPGAMVLGSVNEREVVGRAATRRGPARFLSDGTTASLQLGRQSARVTADQVELAGGRTIKTPRLARGSSCLRHAMASASCSMAANTSREIQ